MAVVGIIMGSSSDLGTMRHTGDALDALAISYEMKILSAHRTPEAVNDYTITARDRGLQVLIAGAGGSAHLAGVIAAKTTLPVLGVPIQSKSLQGVDSLYSIVQMPKGVPVGTLAIGAAGAANAGLLAAAILALKDQDLAKRLEEYRRTLRDFGLGESSKLDRAMSVRKPGTPLAQILQSAGFLLD